MYIFSSTDASLFVSLLTKKEFNIRDFRLRFVKVKSELYSMVYFKLLNLILSLFLIVQQTTTLLCLGLYIGKMIEMKHRQI